METAIILLLAASMVLLNVDVRGKEKRINELEKKVDTLLENNDL